MAKPTQPEPQPSRVKPTESGAIRTRTVNLLDQRKAASQLVQTSNSYVEVDGFRHINLFVQFDAHEAGSPPVDLELSFSLDEKGTVSARHYVNLESAASPLAVSLMSVSGAGSVHGSSRQQTSGYVVRVPVMAPFVRVAVLNHSPHERTVSAWAYLTS